MLTPHQRQALESSHHVCVTANAGSGKTRVLVERYVSLLVSGKASTGELVALTFTDKAASELKRRIAERIAGVIEATTDPVMAARLREIREGLADAAIGTIHSFCTKILREYPVESGIDAAFSVVEGLDQRQMLADSITETFRDRITPGQGSPSAQEVLDSVRVLGKSRILRLITAMVEKRDRLNRLTRQGGVYSLGDTEVLALWGRHLSDAARGALRESRLIADLERVAAIAGGKGAAETRRLLAEFKTAGDVRRLAAAYLALMEKILTVKGGLRKAVGGGEEQEKRLQAEITRLVRHRNAVAPMVSSMLEEGADLKHRSLLSLTRSLLSIAEHVRARYEEKKNSAGQLDFEDILILAGRLLTNEQVRSHLSRRFRFIMVDEYQDTNHLQYEILLPILGQLTSGNLCIVGDPKQSIYRFRDADLSVFERTRSDILRVSGPEGAVILEESFRPLRNIAACINLVFSRIMGLEDGTAGSGGAASRAGVGYEPLVLARQNDDPGRVELLLAGESEPGEGTTEGDLIARRILMLHRGRHRVYDSEGAARDVTFRDIAVLLRDRTPLAGIEEAFIRHGVPYVVSAGVGYFQTQDIFDFHNYLRFLLDPADDVALAGILRSPFFSVSDADLFHHARGRASLSLWDRLRTSDDPPAPGSPLGAAIEQLRDDLVSGLRLPVPQLINRIAETTFYRATLTATRRGDQARANIEKLLRMAREFDALGFVTLRDFVRRLQQLIDEEEKEGQGTIETEDDAVQVMTIHAAKGLEFPVVIQPFLQKPFRDDDDPFFDDACGVGFSTGESDGAAAPLVEYLKGESRKKALAEEQRIFYVACTRARDMLILSGDAGGRRDAVNRMNWLLDGLGIGGSIPGDRLEFPVTTKSLIVREEEFITRADQHVLAVNVIRSIDLPATPPWTPHATGTGKSPTLMLSPVVTSPGGEIYSASKIRTYLDCPALYYFKYIVGLPWSPVPSRLNDDDDLRYGETPGELKGRIVHAVMQNIDALGRDPQRIREEAERVLAREASTGLERSDELLREAVSTVHSIVDSQSWEAIEAGGEAKTEFTISVSLSKDFLTGTMDRVYRDSEGMWTVLDYKTDSINPQRIPERAGLYWPQLRFYGYLVHKYFNVGRVNLVLLFTSGADTPLHMVMNADDFRRFEEEIVRVIALIDRREFSARESHCRECPLPSLQCLPR